jgi:hypothetical protein
MSDDPVLARILLYLEPLNDITLLLLRSQLLVEQQINAALQKILPGAIALDLGRLTFHQRIQVLRALDVSRKAEDALRFAERLNSIHSRPAHHLEPVSIVEATIGFVNDVATAISIKFEDTLPINVRMALCVGYICGVLQSIERATSIRFRNPER